MLTDQGLLLRKVSFRSKPALIAGGSGPIGTLWATYNLLRITAPDTCSTVTLSPKSDSASHYRHWTLSKNLF